MGSKTNKTIGRAIKTQAKNYGYTVQSYPTYFLVFKRSLIYQGVNFAIFKYF